MRIHITLLGLLISSISSLVLCQQHERDAIILRDRKVFIGTLVAQTHQDSIRLRVNDDEVISFSRKEIATITKESVLKIRPAVESASRFRISVSVDAGVSSRERFGTVLGISGSLVLASGLVFNGTLEYWFGNSERDSTVIQYVEQSVPYTVPTGLTDKSRAAAFHFTFGYVFASDWISFVPTAGFGAFVLTSDITYDVKFPPAYLQNEPLDGPRVLASARLGARFQAQVSGPLLVALEASGTALLSPRTGEDKQYYSFIERGHTLPSFTFQLGWAF